MMKTGLNKRWIGVLLCTLIMTTLIGATVIGTFGNGSIACAEESCDGTYTNGFCSADGTHYQAAVYNEEADRYEIGNAGQLYWFAQKVNTENATYGAVNAVLTADITVNRGAVTGRNDSLRQWTPIGDSEEHLFSGAFDGQGHTVSGLYFYTEELGHYHVGLIGNADHATVENVGVGNFYFQSRRAYIGGIVGRMYTTTVRNCYTEGSIYATDVFGTAGGIVGFSGSYDNVISGCLANTALRVSTGEDEFTMEFVGSAPVSIGAIVGAGGGKLSNCVYVTDAYNGAIQQGTYTVTNSHGMALSAMTDGAAAHILGAAWGQNVDNGQTTQPLPVLGGAVVYYGYTNCETDDLHYSNTPLNPTKGHKQGYVGVAHEIVYACTYCGAGEAGRITLMPPSDLIFAENVAKTATYTCTVEGCNVSHAITHCCPDGCMTVGTHTATLSHGGAVATLAFEITSNLEFPSDITVEIATQQIYLTYRGESGVEPTLLVKRGDTELALGTDYSVYYGNNIDVTDEAQATVVLHIDGYEGASKTINFRIDPYKMSGVVAQDSSRLEIEVIYGAPMWDSLPFVLIPHVSDVSGSFDYEYQLVEGKDFIVHLTEEEYQGFGVGVYSLTIEGIGNFTGERTLELDILDADLATEGRFEFNLEDGAYYYNGSQIITPRFTIYDTLRGEYLKMNVDFYMSQESQPGTHDISIVGNGNYTGSSGVLGSFTILPRPAKVDAGVSEIEFDFIPYMSIADKITEKLNPSIALSGSDVCRGFTYEYRKVGDTAYTTGLPTVAGEYEVRVLADSYGFDNVSCYDLSPSDPVKVTVNKIRITVTVFDQILEEGDAVDTGLNYDTYSYEVSLSNNDLGEYNKYFISMPKTLTVSGDDILFGTIVVKDAASQDITQNCEITVTNGKAHFMESVWTPGTETHDRGCTFDGCDYTQKEQHHSHTLTMDEEALTVSGVCGVCNADCGTITLVLPQNAVYNGKPHYATLSGQIHGMDMTNTNYVNLHQSSDPINCTHACDVTLYVYARDEKGELIDASHQVMLSGRYAIDYAPLEIKADDIEIEQYGAIPTEPTYTVVGLAEGHVAKITFFPLVENSNQTGTFDIRPQTIEIFDADGNDVSWNYDYGYASVGTLTITAHTVHGSFDADGICGICGGGYEVPATDENGAYLLSKPGHLFWLAEQMRVDPQINVILTNNIDLNEGYVFSTDADGNPIVKKGDEIVSDLSVLRVWTPIWGYNGTFDGQDHVISGLYFDNTSSGAGFFGSIGASATVKNLGLVNSYIRGGYNTAGIVGNNETGGTITACYNAATVVGAYTGVGGVVGINRGNVNYCYNTGAIFGNGGVGGIVGVHVWGDITHCYNTGAIRSDLSAGGIAGTTEANTLVLNCYNTAEVTATGTWKYAGGIVGENGGSVWNCYNTGDVTSTDGVSVGGIVGANEYSGSNGSSAGSVDSCYSTGIVSAQGTGSTGGIVGFEGSGTVRNCFYLVDTANGGIEGEDVADSAEAKTAAQFASGEVAFLLGSGVMDSAWGQTLGTQAFPVIGGTPVYCYLDCNGSTILYTGVENTPQNTHVDENRDHTCDKENCGQLVGDHVAAEGSHDCDWCGEAVTECFDANDDHLCDTCGDTLSDCEDANRDHNCDICTTPLSECADDDRNHLCDVCLIPLSECGDEDEDHRCDVCDATLSACDDLDNDHRCDLCDEVLTACFDEMNDGDHACDTCEAILSECFDGDDHACDECGATTGACADEDDDHLCDVCDERLSDCADSDGDGACDACGAHSCLDSDFDHACDVCGAWMGDHVQANESTHDCPYCGEPVNACFDEDLDHECDLCGELYGEHVESADSHACVHCGETVGECRDTVNVDHLCDVCGEVLSECVPANGGNWLITDEHHWKQCEICLDMLEEQEVHHDGDDDHDCDVCEYRLTDCVDADSNHKCDTCDAILSYCRDWDNNHMCDDCGVKVNDCYDTDDHKCDICGADYDDCEDASGDHHCDVCNEILSECVPANGGDWLVTDAHHWKQCEICLDMLEAEEAHYDNNNDHLCDVCEYCISNCEDTDRDHKCDKCEDTLSDCIDTDPRDHDCDVCGAQMGTHEAAQGKHTCDWCGATVTDCNDADSDHDCDVCGAQMGTHEAAQGKHTCDWCGATVTDCNDADSDHDCDVCGAQMGTHEAAQGKHTCDWCGATVTACNDADTDHDCDVCGAQMGKHEAAQGKHTCDWCGATVTACNDADTDHACDVCGAQIGTHEAAQGKHTCDWCGATVTACNDADTDHDCDVCGAQMGTHEAAQGKHTCDWCGATVTACNDADTDHDCDVCGKAVSEHAWSDATCTDPKTCTVCGATEGSVNAHTPGEWVIDTPAAPGVAGQKHQSCTACGAVVNTESIEALPIETLPTDTAPSTDTPTEPVTEPTATTPTEEQSGCAASVKGGSAIVLITLLGIGVMLLRKKRTNQK